MGCTMSKEARSTATITTTTEGPRGARKIRHLLQVPQKALRAPWAQRATPSPEGPLMTERELYDIINRPLRQRPGLMGPRRHDVDE